MRDNDVREHPFSYTFDVFFIWSNPCYVKHAILYTNTPLYSLSRLLYFFVILPSIFLYYVLLFIVYCHILWHILICKHNFRFVRQHAIYYIIKLFPDYRLLFLVSIKQYSTNSCFSNYICISVHLYNRYIYNVICYMNEMLRFSYLSSRSSLLSEIYNSKRKTVNLENRLTDQFTYLSRNIYSSSFSRI